MTLKVWLPIENLLLNCKRFNKKKMTEIVTMPL